MNSSKVGGGSDDIGEGINQNADNYFNVIAFTNDIVIIIVVTSLQKKSVHNDTAFPCTCKHIQIKSRSKPVALQRYLKVMCGKKS